MKNNLSRFVLLTLDLLSVYGAIVLAYWTRIALNPYTSVSFDGELLAYTHKLLIYLIIFATFFYEGIYTKRYDFWHESREIIKSLILSLLLLLAFLAFTKSIENFSRTLIVFAFIYMAVLIPIIKYISKKYLYKVGIWKREAKVFGDDEFLKREIFKNHYLGYVESDDLHVKTVFINAKTLSIEELRASIDKEIALREEVIFIPFFNDYNLAQSSIYQLTNTRTNLIVLQNKLKNRWRRFLQAGTNYLLSLVILPFVTPVLALIAYRIKKEEPQGNIFFKQERMGKDEKTFMCYKFRSMRENSEEILQEYLSMHPEEIENYRIYHKYENDPRITKIGALLRRTSLDELPQIINIFKGEMSLIGPRPYMLNEKEKIGSKLQDVLAVKPGISGLWQVSGRSEVDFHSRVDLDVYYTKNWSLWLDIVILVKTIKVVLFREGAY